MNAANEAFQVTFFLKHRFLYNSREQRQVKRTSWLLRRLGATWKPRRSHHLLHARTPDSCPTRSCKQDKLAICSTSARSGWQEVGTPQAGTPQGLIFFDFHDCSKKGVRCDFLASSKKHHHLQHLLKTKGSIWSAWCINETSSSGGGGIVAKDTIE